MATETKKADSSVVMALSELVKIEEHRIEEEREREVRRAADARAERERAEAAAREAERQRAERAAQEQRVAEAEARLRVEADRERDQRIAAMREELARVQAERATMRADLESRPASPSREPSRPSGWAMAFGLSSLVAASLAGLLVVQGSQTSAQPLPAPALDTPVVVAPAAPVVEVPVASAPITAPEAETVAAAEPTSRARPPRHVPHDRVQTTHAHEPTGTEIIGLGTDDPSGDLLTPDLLVHDAGLHH